VSWQGETQAERIARSNMICNAVLAVEHALTPDECDRILTDTARANPHMQGAAVADVLDICSNADGALSWTEPFYEDHVDVDVETGDDNAAALLGISSGNRALPGMVVLAAALLHRRVPTVDECRAIASRLAQDAVGE
jgi:hypothetical protein